MYYKILRAISAPFVMLYYWACDKDTEEAVWFGIIGGISLAIIPTQAFLYWPMNDFAHFCNFLVVLVGSVIVGAIIATAFAPLVVSAVERFSKPHVKKYDDATFKSKRKDAQKKYRQQQRNMWKNGPGLERQD